MHKGVHQGELITFEVVEVPLGAIGQDSDVALGDVVTPFSYVPSELIYTLGANVADSEVFLDLNDRAASLDIDSTLPRGSLSNAGGFKAIGVEIESTTRSKALIPACTSASVLVTLTSQVGEEDPQVDGAGWRHGRSLGTGLLWDLVNLVQVLRQRLSR